MTKQKLQQLVDTLTEALSDAEKFDSGNDAAGRRVRAAAQEVKTELQALRQQVQAERNSRKNK